ncbi:CGNR zinc finger domain-containing protein [Pseudonocardia sp.]|uniref:CGNR zinc finger domain-containing protein n=1 Tax=Pseudonocardia sp. TaxID=60912 RepID=UPI003D0AE96D
MEHQAGDAAERRFLFLGGHVALDFVNTVMVENGEVVDRLTSPGDLAAWVAVSDLGPRYGTPDTIGPAVYAQAIGLRGALKAGLDALVVGEPVPDATVATLNAILRNAPGSQLRRSGPEGLRHVLRVDLAADAGPLPWLLADAAATLLAGEDAGRLRRCANCDTCVLMFLDTSRSHTRRWCSMELCGNRSKVAAHHARRRLRDGGLAAPS